MRNTSDVLGQVVCIIHHLPRGHQWIIPISSPIGILNPESPWFVRRDSGGGNRNSNNPPPRTELSYFGRIAANLGKLPSPGNERRCENWCLWFKNRSWRPTGSLQSAVELGMRGFDLLFIWHKHEGWRKNHLLNKAWDVVVFHMAYHGMILSGLLIGDILFIYSFCCQIAFLNTSNIYHLPCLWGLERGCL